MPTHLLQDVQSQLKFIYPDQWESVAEQLQNLINSFKASESSKTTKPAILDQTDIMLITYGDSVYHHDHPPLTTLHDFYKAYGRNTFSAVHILPFFPWTSDDGFSVVNYHQIDPALGDWNHVEMLAGECDLMFDAVVNHISKSSSWFQKYLAGHSEVENYFISADPQLDYSLVTRPRNLPLLTPFTTATGEKHIWTTFSEDQIDLNFKEPDVLLAITEVLINYAQRGSRFIRLDAIGFLWKAMGTPCIHLPQTHALIQVMRKVLDIVVPGTLLITETNVPHKENISYFGNGANEASLVYQFPLPPLMVHTLLTGDSTVISDWASTLIPPSDTTTFLNFLASHDGIGVRPATGLLQPEDIDRLQKHTLAQEGNVSFKDNGDGTQSPYELNITFFDAISSSELNQLANQKRMLVAHSILLALQGLPAIYIHSFLGSHNDGHAVVDSGIFRRINRTKLEFQVLTEELEHVGSERFKIHSGIERLAKARKGEPLFSPRVKQTILKWSSSLVAIERGQDSNEGKMVCLANVTNERVKLPKACDGFELISRKEVSIVELAPYEIAWVKTG
jgi:sucrose phosphorylase